MEFLHNRRTEFIINAAFLYHTHGSLYDACVETAHSDCPCICVKRVLNVHRNIIDAAGVNERCQSGRKSTVCVKLDKIAQLLHLLYEIKKVFMHGRLASRDDHTVKHVLPLSQE